MSDGEKRKTLAEVTEEIRQAEEHYRRRIRAIDREHVIRKWVAILIFPVTVVFGLLWRWLF